MPVAKWNATQPKYAVVARKLSSRVLTDLPAGSKLPSIRNLMADLKTSQATIDRALKLLWENGEITKIDGTGYFARACSNHAGSGGGRMIPVDFCFFFRGQAMNNPLYSKLLASLMKYGKDYHFQINIFPYEEMGSVQEFQDKLLRSGSKGTILLGATKSSFEYALRRMEIPSVHLYPNWFDDQCHTILIDNFRCMELLMNDLVEHGHRNIAMLHGQGYDNFYMIDQEERIEAYFELVKRYGLPVIPLNVLFGGYSEDTGYRAARELMARSPQMRPTAVMANDYNVSGVYRAVRETGLMPGRDISITGFDNLETAPLLAPSLSSLDISYKKAVRCALSTLRQRMDNPTLKGELKRIEPLYYRRDSVQQNRQ